MRNSTVKVTKKDNFNALIAYLTDSTAEVDVDALVEFCQNEIALLDKRSAKAKETAAAKKSEGDALTEAIAAVLPADFTTIDDVVALINDPEVTRGKVQYRLTQLVKAGTAEKGEVATSVDGKTKKIAAYRAVV